MVMWVDCMGEYVALDKMLMEIKTLYESYDKTSEFIMLYTNKYAISNIHSAKILTSYKLSSYKDILSVLLDRNLADFNVLLKARFDELECLKLLTLSEIAHNKSKKIEFLIDNPFFFEKLRSEHRNSVKILDKLDEDAFCNKRNFGKCKSEFEKIIEGFISLDDDIEDEKRSGLYKMIGGGVLLTMPIVIGIFQLIAMQFFPLNPYLIMVFYIVALFMLYVLLGFFSHVKLLFISFKTNIFSTVPFIVPFSILAPIIYFSSVLIKLSDFEISILVISVILAILMIITFGKLTIEKIKNELNENEFNNLVIKYGIKN